MRVLYYVPIVHTPQESGPFRKEVEKYLIQRRGREAISQTEKMVQAYWQLANQKIEKEIEKGNLECSNLYIYVDSFPIGMEEEFAKIRIEAKIPYWLIIKKLVDRGAKLIGTEDLKLYQEQAWEVIQAMRKIDFDSVYLQRVTSQDLEKTYQLSKLMHLRDVFIARRIEETLPENGQGILFMGRKHKVIEELDKLEEAGQLSSPMKVIYL